MSSQMPQEDEVGWFAAGKFRELRKWKWIVAELSRQRRSCFCSERDQLTERIREGEVSATIATKLLLAWAEPVLREERLEYVRSQIPAAFLAPLDRAKMANPFATDQVMTWWTLDKDKSDEPPDEYIENLGRGILAFGSTGSGKTRSILARLAEVYVEEDSDRKFEFVRTVDLSAQVRRLAPRRGDELEEYIQRLSTVPVLFLDDLHQSKLTPRYAEELFRIVDTRTSSDELPLFVSSQMPGVQLIEKLAGDNPDLRLTAEAILRRLREFCHSIDFDYRAG
jgi:hypothetical protein